MERKNEIAAKKAKLAELRRQREEREQRQKSLPKGETPVESASEAAPPPVARARDRQDLDSYITTLVGEGKRASLGPGETGTFSPARKSRPSSILSTDQLRTDSRGRDTASPPAAPPPQTTSVSTQTISTAAISVNYEFVPVAGHEILSYSKAIQTAGSGSTPRRDRASDGASGSESDRSPSRKAKRLSRREREREEELRQNIRREIEEELKAVEEPPKSGASPSAQSNYPARALTDEELNAVTSSDDFLDFVDRSSKVIEKALDQEYDVLVDYGVDGLNLDGEEDEGYGSAGGKKGRRIKEVAQFYDERWSRKRMISDLGYSPKFPELLLASYTKNPAAPQDPSGLVQVWNMHLHSRPEYIFHATSDVLTARFSPFHPSLILGGSYSGQVLVWDTRSKSPLPVQKTPLTGASSGGHTHPIYAISVIGTQNANNIMSCSTDGVVCGWTVDMLSQPQEYLELIAPPPSKYEDISPTCMSFPSSDPTSFLIGTEEGTIYPCHRYDRAGAKAGVDARLRYKGHAAPVMGVDFHPVRGPVDLGDLVLSSALDWSVKLWKTRAPSSTAATPTTGQSNPNMEVVQPLLDFAREDVVYDARWAPQKPGVFALVDGAGKVEVWDLTVDTEIPVTTASPEMNKKAAQAGLLPKSLNKVVWEEKEGKRLAAGGASGVVSVFEVGPDLANDGLRSEEWASMKRLLARAGVVKT